MTPRDPPRGASPLRLVGDEPAVAVDRPVTERARGDTSGPVVVLGGGGFVGSAITRRLVSDGYDVIVAEREPPTDLDRLAGARVLMRDAGDPAIYEELLEGAAAVVYAVGCLFPGESNASPVSDIQNALTPLIQLLEALRRQPEVPMVFLSSGGTVYGNPMTIPVTEDHPTNPRTSYGILKLAGEKYIGMYRQLYGVQASVLRVANAYGPFQPPGRGQGVVGVFVERVARGLPVRVFGSGRVVRDYIHVDDVARAVGASIATATPNTLNIGTGVGTSVLQMVQLLEEISGRTIALDHLPSRDFDVESIVLDVATFRALVGRDPIDFTAGLTTTYEWALREAHRRGVACAGHSS